jgi:hypothetical protein
MTSFDKLYRELMEVWSPEYKIQIPKSDADSCYFENRKDINKFAFESPEKMFIVVAFVMITMRTAWHDVVEQFPHFMKWFFETAVKKGKISKNIIPPGGGGGGAHMMLYPNKQGGPSLKLSYIFEAWENRKKIYNAMGELKGDTAEMCIWVLENIKGLGLPKTGFFIQLINGRLGCIDSINSKIYGGDLDTRVSGNPRSPKNMEKIEHYINFTDPINKELWDDWCEIVARKTSFALPDVQPKFKGDIENRNIVTINKDGERVNQSPYFINKGNIDKIAKSKERYGHEGGYKIIGRDHYDILKDTEKYLESHNFQFHELYKELKESYNESPFAVFVVYQYPDGKVAATTRPKDRMGDDDGVSYGLPGGKVDPGEDPMDAAIRESEEEGWIISGLTHKHSAMVQGKMVWWYRATNAKPLKEYKEKYRGIKPVKINPQKLKGFGNEVALPKTLHESKNTKSFAYLPSIRKLSDIPKTPPYGFWMDKNGYLEPVYKWAQHNEIAYDLLKNKKNLYHTENDISKIYMDRGWVRLITGYAYGDMKYQSSSPLNPSQKRTIDYLKSIYTREKRKETYPSDLSTQDDVTFSYYD